MKLFLLPLYSFLRSAQKGSEIHSSVSEFISVTEVVNGLNVLENPLFLSVRQSVTRGFINPDFFILQE